MPFCFEWDQSAIGVPIDWIVSNKKIHGAVRQVSEMKAKSAQAKFKV